MIHHETWDWDPVLFYPDTMRAILVPGSSPPAVIHSVTLWDNPYMPHHETQCSSSHMPWDWELRPPPCSSHTHQCAMWVTVFFQPDIMRPGVPPAMLHRATCCQCHYSSPHMCTSVPAATAMMHHDEPRCSSSQTYYCYFTMQIHPRDPVVQQP